MKLWGETWYMYDKDADADASDIEAVIACSGMGSSPKPESPLIISIRAGDTTLMDAWIELEDVGDAELRLVLEMYERQALRRVREGLK